MSLFRLIPARSWLGAGGAVLAGLIGGGCGAGLIALINTALNRPDLSRTTLVAALAALVAGKVVANAVARLLLHHFTLATVTDLCRDLSRRVLAAPLRHLEQVGIPRILATLTEDVAMIGWAAQSVPSLATNGAMLVGCAIYLGWLSWPILLAMMGFVVVGALCYRVLIRRAYRYIQRARDTRDVLFQHFRALTEGMKELKLHAGRREAFLTDRIDATAEALRRDSLTGLRHDVVASAWTQLLFYGLLGGLLVTAPVGPGRDAETVTGYLLATLYMMTPLWGIIEAWPILARGRIALERVGALGLALEARAGERRAPVAPAARPDWQQLELDGVTFTYPADLDGEAFVLGPLDLILRRGELVFVVGGNGSGKSTLVKVLTGLYWPQVGALRLDGVPTTDKNREW
ncbi:MAG: ATP-binding cassette domain-containing protein, partial [Candidatus Rokubacteria bacterium]|nr:ATP-binding cassette domain-containing protein [Candidatus Rokubacteria bacterium]